MADLVCGQQAFSWTNIPPVPDARGMSSVGQTFIENLLFARLPAMGETWVRSLGWEDPLEKGKAIHSSILDWKMDYKVHGVAKSQT